MKLDDRILWRVNEQRSSHAFLDNSGCSICYLMQSSEGHQVKKRDYYCCCFCRDLIDDFKEDIKWLKGGGDG